MVPFDNAEEAALTKQGESFAAKTLLEVCAHLHDQLRLSPNLNKQQHSQNNYADLADVRGQASSQTRIGNCCCWIA